MTITKLFFAGNCSVVVECNRAPLCNDNQAIYKRASVCYTVKHVLVANNDTDLRHVRYDYGISVIGKIIHDI